MSPLRAWHLYSLDAPTVAVTWCIAFARAAHAPLPPAIPVFLGLATWIAYVGDRVLDAKLTHDAALLRERHHFYGAAWRDRRPLVLGALAAASATASWLAAFVLPRPVFVAYGVVAAVSICYFAVVHARDTWLERALPKEAIVGLVFAAATSLPTWLTLHAQHRPSARLDVAMVLFAALAWLNCVCIEAWEGETGVVVAFAPRITSIKAHSSTQWAARHLRPLLQAFFLVAVLATLWAFVQKVPLPLQLAPLLALSFALLTLLDRLRGRLAPVTLRALADLVLMTPFALVASLVMR